MSKDGGSDMTILNYAELIYYITGGPVLTITAIFGLRHIYLAKKSLQISSRRDAYRLSSRQIHYYLTEIIPILNKLDKKLKENELSDIEDHVHIEVQDDVLMVRIDRSDEKVNKLLEIEEISMLTVKALNHLESFSHPLASKLASEEVAYMSLGTTYTNSVKKLLPFMLVAGTKYFRCTNHLFEIWYRRREAEQLSEKRNKISNQLENLNGGVVLTPIGDE